MIATRMDAPRNVDFMGAEKSEQMHLARYNNEKPNEVVQNIFNDFKQAQLGPVLAPE